MPSRVVICAHKPLAGDIRFARNRPRGGEISVAILRDHLSKRWNVLTLVRRLDQFGLYLQPGDVALTWGAAVEETHRACRARGIPYVHMVRWWRNVCPLPPGDLMTDPIHPPFVRSHQHLFDDAAAVVTNNVYAANVLRRWYGVDAFVSYVPITGSAKDGGDPNGPIVMVTDNKGVGASALIRELAAAMPDRRFLVVNATERYAQPNIAVCGYREDMDNIWQIASVLINPIIGQDGCGTGRTMMEAMRYGVPVVGTDRAGLLETGGYGVSRYAHPYEWVAVLEAIFGDYHKAQSVARASFAAHDPVKEMDVYSDIIAQL